MRQRRAGSPRLNAGAVAFSPKDDPDLGVYADAVVLRCFGEVPDDLATLF
jgi:hypothetical protein